MIYIDSCPEGFTDKMYRAALTEVSEQRRKKAERFLTMGDRKRCVRAYRLLQEGLKLEYGIDGNPEFVFNENEKPFLREHPAIHFSLSHCERAVACCLSDRPVGIDVETIRPFDREMAEYICHESELSEILASPHPEISFTVLWTKKESLCKMLGCGLPSKNGLREILLSPPPCSFDTTVNNNSGYVLTICRQQSRRHIGEAGK